MISKKPYSEKGTFFGWSLNKNSSLSAVENGEHCDFTILRNMLIR